MAIRKKNYSMLLKSGVPKVIFYEHKKIGDLEIEYFKPAEVVCYNKKDIFNSQNKVEKIDIDKKYESIE